MYSMLLQTMNKKICLREHLIPGLKNDGFFNVLQTGRNAPVLRAATSLAASGEFRARCQQLEILSHWR